MRRSVTKPRGIVGDGNTLLVEAFQTLPELERKVESAADGPASLLFGRLARPATNWRPAPRPHV